MIKAYCRIVMNYLKFWHLRRKENDIFPIQSFSFGTKLEIHRSSSLMLGRNIISDGRSYIHVGEYARLIIGKGVYFNDGIKISCKKSIEIGEGCLFGPDVKIYDNNHCFERNAGVSCEYNADSVFIGKKCWIGANVVILKGAQIGDYCVIGAGCVVNGKIPDNTLVKAKRELEFIPIASVERKVGK